MPTQCGGTHLGCGRGVGLVEQRPDPRLDALPAVELARLELLLEAELLHDVLLRRLVGVEVEPVEDLQRRLRVAVRRVRHPAARLHLVRVEAPELQFLLEQRAAHVGRVVQLAGAVVVEDLREDARMAVEEELVQHRIVVGERLRETRQARRRNLLQRRLVRLVTDAAHVEDHTIFGVGHPQPALTAFHASPRHQRIDRLRVCFGRWSPVAAGDCSASSRQEARAAARRVIIGGSCAVNAIVVVGDSHMSVARARHARASVGRSSLRAFRIVSLRKDGLKATMNGR